jgi:hypothetical protein
LFTLILTLSLKGEGIYIYFTLTPALSLEGEGVDFPPYLPREMGIKIKG